MTFAEFVQSGHYNRSDGAVVCGHNIPVGPGACVECHSLTDDHQQSGCTCDIDAYDAAVAGADASAEASMERARVEERDLIRREMASDLSDWIRVQCRNIGYTRAGAWQQIADKIDPRKVPSRNGLRSYWNQGETW